MNLANFAVPIIPAQRVAPAKNQSPRPRTTVQGRGMDPHRSSLNGGRVQPPPPALTLLWVVPHALEEKFRGQQMCMFFFALPTSARYLRRAIAPRPPPRDGLLGGACFCRGVSISTTCFLPISSCAPLNVRERSPTRKRVEGVVKMPNLKRREMGR